MKSYFNKIENNTYSHLSLDKVHLILLSILFILLKTGIVFSQNNVKNPILYDPGKKFSLYVYGDYISSSTMQPHPNSLDPIDKDEMIDLNGTYGFGAEISYKPHLYDLDLIFYLSTEYLKLSQNDLGITLYIPDGSVTLNMTEKFTMIPLEFGAKWHLPVGTDNMKIYIGGGGGIYFGKETRTILNLESTQISSKPEFSLNILSGVEYYFERNISADLELKFREAAFITESRFSAYSILYNGNEYQLENPFYTRFIADGVKISLGVKYHF
jgi:opacity protein-like surface antigen